MPLDKSIKKVLIIGSGPIVIGQAAEFDYSGTQACTTLKEEGINVVLVNSNPATIMTDKLMADSIYLEPLNKTVLERIIEKEKPDSILPTLGGQTALTLAMELADNGVLDKHGVRLLGCVPSTIDKAENRELFKQTMLQIGQPVIESATVTSVTEALEFVKEYPVILRPAYTLGGTGGGIVKNEIELKEMLNTGLSLSPINQVLVEKSVAGWKEIEFEVMRDSNGNKITVCSMENIDPVGIHTGDSIVVAPALTLADKEYQMLRSAALDIIEALDITGGCNCQFALNPNSFEYAVIEVNPRVSRSSALASKATGYPIAKIASKIAVGYTLPEIINEVTVTTSSCFEPALDYVVVKFPRFPFDKFFYANKTLGTQMKATGEVMAIAATFENAFMKALRGLEIGVETLYDAKYSMVSDDVIKSKLITADNDRMFYIAEALRRSYSIELIHELTKIDCWFINKIKNIFDTEKLLRINKLNEELYYHAKLKGFTDSTIEKLSGQKFNYHLPAVYKTVDTCASEFASSTPYFYADYIGENEALEYISKRKSVLVIGSGPIRIGQGIEFDYSCVHCVWALKKAGYEVAMINNNPETVSTDYNTADRLYFEPLTPEDLINVINTEKPEYCVVSFGGQTSIKLAKTIEKAGVKLLGTSLDSIDCAEDRKRFDAMLEELNILRAAGSTVFTIDEALKVTAELGYPVLLRPSYVLGGQNMLIAFDDNDVIEYMSIILSHDIENPVLIDKYLSGRELEVDAIFDGDDILIPSIMEHIERAGIHSGDSIAVSPVFDVSEVMIEKIILQSRILAGALNVRGTVNIQYLIYQDELYVIEVNPRSSRTVPYISKVTDIPVIDIAVRVMLGEKLADVGYGSGLIYDKPYTAVKVPVFSFEKLLNVDVQLGPEMKSTGEALGLAKTLDEALFKGLTAAGYKIYHSGKIFITVKDADKNEIIPIAKMFYDMGFEIFATKGTAEIIGVPCNIVNKIHESSESNSLTLIQSGILSYIISTSAKGRLPTRDSVKIRRTAIEKGIICITAIDTAKVLADCIKSNWTFDRTELININNPEEI